MHTQLTDADVESVLRGHDVRAELRDLEAAVAHVRAEVPLQAVPWPPGLAVAVRSVAPAGRSRKLGVAARRRIIRWSAGLGISAQALMASTGAAAALAAGGWFGVLPDSLQRQFDELAHRDSVEVDSAPEPGVPPGRREFMRPGPGGDLRAETVTEPTGSSSDGAGHEAGSGSQPPTPRPRGEVGARDDAVVEQPSGPVVPEKSTPLRERDDEDDADASDVDAGDDEEDWANDARDGVDNPDDPAEDDREERQDHDADREETEPEDADTGRLADRSEREPDEDDPR